MPTYRFPEAVKSANIPFSQGRDYKPVIGVDRLEKQKDVLQLMSTQKMDQETLIYPINFKKFMDIMI